MQARITPPRRRAPISPSEDTSDGEKRCPSNAAEDKSRITIIIQALVFTCIVTLVPWPEVFHNLNGRELTDRSTYLRQINHNDLIYDYYSYSDPLDYYTDEYLWGWSLRALSDLGIAGETILDTIAFVFIAILSVLVLRHLPWPFLLFLLNPLVLSMAYSQSRSATMAILLFLAFFAWKYIRLLTLIFVAAAMFIHTSTPLFLAIFFFSSLRRAEGKSIWNAAWPVIGGVLVAAASGPWMETILGSLGDRRATYTDMSSGILFLSFWALCFIYMLSIWPKISWDFWSRISMCVFTIASFSIIFESYASRFITIFFAAVIIGLCRQFATIRQNALIVALLASYIIILWELQFI